MHFPAHNSGAASKILEPLADPGLLPLETPLPHAVFHQDGTMLLPAGGMLNSEQRDFLFAHFQPHQDTAQEASMANAQNGPADRTKGALALDDMNLAIGALLGIRSQAGMGREMLPCRLIGFRSGGALFVTPPASGNPAWEPFLGEQVEIVAIATQAVFWLVCTVEAVCAHPFRYLVLSEPGTIRRLRERRAIRVRTQLAVRYGVDLTGSSLERLGIGCDISVLGMSLAAGQKIGEVGERICVVFPIEAGEAQATFQAVAVIRNLRSDTPQEGLTLHGLEFDPLAPESQIALKTFVFDRQDAVSYWAGMPG
ncbi:MAG TPA: flagellar brake protein [Paraburkholderia sp.]|uniref:flagellar brake protein n=1 Tax=Paraburkholderia sp. TaxID=1926495 RepID=UPI002C791552|nr:flagellar brake protein [Paraburkholderia sp.]HTR05126.1 flagellar brake protein [Paraburkholderia sp.]